MVMVLPSLETVRLAVPTVLPSRLKAAVEELEFPPLSEIESAYG